MRVPKVSIIVPVYNGELFLTQCLDSIQAQTLRDIEVICVNDGSTDSSREIINRYVNDDIRFKLIDKENTGYGNSVNVGIAASTGEWIGVVEADDFIDPFMYKVLYQNTVTTKGDEVDIVKSSYWLYFDKDGDIPEHVEKPFLATCMSEDCQELTAFDNPEILSHHPSIWSAIYRKQFLIDKNIRMIEPRGAGWTDNPWLFETMLQADRIIWIPFPYYYYRQTNPLSSTHLKDYQLPFERLNDIRGFINSNRIEDPAILNAFYTRSLNYVYGSILEDGGFEELDPDLWKLINEEFSQLDSATVIASGNGIAKRKKDYFKDVTGEKISKLNPYLTCEEPGLSIILLLDNDREGIWDTINSVLQQEFTDFEVICADLGSRDRSAEIVKDIEVIDRRFHLIKEPFESSGKAFIDAVSRCRAPYCLLLKPGVIIGGKKWFDGVLANAKEGVDLVASEHNLRRFKKYRIEKIPSTIELRGEREQALAAGNLNPLPYGKAYRTDFIKSLLRDPDVLDDQLLSLQLLACMAASTIVVFKDLSIGIQKRLEIETRHRKQSGDAIDYLEKTINLFSNFFSEHHDVHKVVCASSFITRVLASFDSMNLSLFGGKRAFDYVKEVYGKMYGLRNNAKMGFTTNSSDIYILEKMMLCDYTQYCMEKYSVLSDAYRDLEEHDRLRVIKMSNYKQSLNSLKDENRAMRKELRKYREVEKRNKELRDRISNLELEIRKIKESRSYKIARRASKVIKRFNNEPM